MNKVIGKCSLCGGEVCVPKAWHGTHPPTPTCRQCHAVAEVAGPVIPMKPAPQQQQLLDMLAKLPQVKP